MVLEERVLVARRWSPTGWYNSSVCVARTKYTNEIGYVLIMWGEMSCILGK